MWKALVMFTKLRDKQEDQIQNDVLWSSEGGIFSICVRMHSNNITLNRWLVSFSKNVFFLFGEQV